MRLQSVILWTNMTTNAFAMHIGLPRAENLYQIKRGNYGISMRLATLIVDKFPDINMHWLLNGEGEMLNAKTTHSVTVPYYDEDVCRSVGTVTELRPVSEIVVPAVVRCDFAMRCDDGCPSDAGFDVTIVLLRRCTGELPSEGEYVVVNEGVASIVRLGGGAVCNAAVCEVVGRITLKGAGA